MTQIVERTILFADLRGSTSLYESMGNAEATAVVTQSVSLLARIVESMGGQVVKTLGDGLMAMFILPKAALAAAEEIHDSMERIGGRGTPMQTLKVQVAMACGEVVQMSGDVFGDAVNVAARLLDHAGDNETLLTAAVLAGLPLRSTMLCNWSAV